MTNDDELEARLREALVARDPGDSAPDGLRRRVGQVPESRVRPRPLAGGGWVRGASGLLATAAAVVIGLVAVNALRVSGPGLQGAGGTPSPTSPGNLTPVVVLAAPPAFDGPTLSTILTTALLLLWLTAWGLATAGRRNDSSTPRQFPRGLRWLRRARLRSAVFGLAIAAAVAYPLAVGVAARLGSGSAAASSSVGLLGGRDGVGRLRPMLFYAGRSDSTISVAFSVRNSGAVPLTVLGLDPACCRPPGEELRRFEHEDPNVAQSADDPATVPFTSFELGPGEERYLVFVDHEASCPGPPAAAAPAGPRASATPDMNTYEPPATSGQSSVDSVQLNFSALGIAERVEVPFAWSLILVCP